MCLNLPFIDWLIRSYLWLFFYSQESVPEFVELKQKVFREVDAVCSDDIILSSSTSCIVPSRFTLDLKHKKNCLVSHPVCIKYCCIVIYEFTLYFLLIDVFCSKYWSVQNGMSSFKASIIQPFMLFVNFNLIFIARSIHQPWYHLLKSCHLLKQIRYVNYDTL